MSKFPSIQLQLMILAKKRDLAQAKLERLLAEDSRIADDIRDFWKHQRSGAE